MNRGSTRAQANIVANVVKSKTANRPHREGRVSRAEGAEFLGVEEGEAEPEDEAHL